MDPTGNEPQKPDARSLHFPCTSCGGELNWDPGASQMKCPYCDSLVEVPKDEEFEAAEHDLLAFLDEHPTAEGYGVQLEGITCRSCGAKIQAPPGRRDPTCAFCGSKYVLESEGETKEVLKPESVLPFEIPKERCQKTFKQWIGSGWFRPSNLKKLSKLDRIQGLYMPFFTFDAQADSRWTAESGTYYYVTEQVPVREGGRTVYKTRRVRKVRWRPASGSRSDFHDDVLVPSVTDEHLNLLMKVFPYNLKVLKPYDSRYLVGFGILNSELPLTTVYGIAQSNMESEQISRCARDIPGDTYRNLEVQTLLSGQTFKHLLCPLWIGSFKYKGTVYPFVVNGQTGKLFGKKPWSVIKIVLFVLSLLAAGGIGYLVLSQLS